MDRRPKVLALACVMFVLCVVGTHLWARPGFLTIKPKAAVKWHTELQAAHKLAVQTNRPLLIVFGAPWCGYCRKLEHETRADAALVKQVNSSFVAVHLDFQKDRRVADLLEVKSLPTTVLLSTDADVLGTIVGYLDKAAYRTRLDEALRTEQSIRLTGGSRR